MERRKEDPFFEEWAEVTWRWILMDKHVPEGVADMHSEELVENTVAEGVADVKYKELVGASVHEGCTGMY